MSSSRSSPDPGSNRPQLDTEDHSYEGRPYSGAGESLGNHSNLVNGQEIPGARDIPSAGDAPVNLPGRALPNDNGSSAGDAINHSGNNLAGGTKSANSSPQASPIPNDINQNASLVSSDLGDDLDSLAESNSESNSELHPEFRELLDLPSAVDEDGEEIEVDGQEIKDDGEEMKNDDEGSLINDDSSESHDSDNEGADDSSVDVNVMSTISDVSGYDDRASIHSLVVELLQKRREITRLSNRMRKRERGFRRRMKARKDLYTAEKQMLNLRILRLEEEVRDMHRPRIPWIELMDDLLHERPRNLDGNEVDWEVVFQASCRTMNMSQDPATVHPNLFWKGRRCNDQELRRPYQDILRDAAINRGIGPSPAINQDIPYPNMKEFSFANLSMELQKRVFELIFFKKGVIHCLSRLNVLDQPAAPANFPLPCSGDDSLPRRFVFGNQRGSAIPTWKPNDVLYPLLVCKRWLYIGGHAFYGMNTFAFSSLGEFGRFFAGIGQARAERVAHGELLWHGSIMPRHETRINQRTKPLKWLTQMKRLETLVVFIVEKDEGRIRRKYEFPKVGRRNKHNVPDRDRDFTEENIADLNAPQSLLKRTAMQPNCRGNRSLRTCHGMDYIYQLRGMQWVRFYEVDPARKIIRDWSFIDDVNSQVTMPKNRTLAIESDLRNLTTLGGLDRYIPEDQDEAMIASFYETHDLPSVLGGSDTSKSSRGSAAESINSSNGTDRDNDTDMPDGDQNGDPLPANKLYRDDWSFGGHSDIVDKDGDPMPANIRYPDEWSLTSDMEMADGSRPDQDYKHDDNISIYTVKKEGSVYYGGHDSGVEDINGVDDNVPFSDDSDDEDGGQDTTFDGSDRPQDTQNTSQDEVIRNGDGMNLDQGTLNGDDDNDDDDGLFVPLNRDASPGNRLDNASPNPFVASSAANAPARLLKKPRIIIDLTIDDDEDNEEKASKGSRGSSLDDNMTAGDRDDRTDLDSLFANTFDDGASTSIKTESGSSDDARRRRVIVDLTGHGDDEPEVKPASSKKGSDQDRKPSSRNASSPIRISGNGPKSPKHELDDGGSDHIDGPVPKRARTLSPKQERGEHSMGRSVSSL
ncbi:hypothetical protein SCAR479_10242 [Seiridium cardinale]|uniref:Uncharacterized protein n=1 Tax=Seiridium cardinale TaxID=138064 RepID=A0ABR2XHF6_9PEZI